MPVTLELNPVANAFETRPSLRTVYVTGSVDCELAHQTIVALEGLDHTDGDIRIVLNSEGGSEEDGYAIHDAITMCRNRVIIDGYGSVQSIAAAIFQAGDLRRLAPNAIFMIHNGSMEELEPIMLQDKIQEMAANIEKGNQRYYTILANASQQAMETIASWCKDETTFDAEEAVNACFADEIIPPLKNRIPMKKKRKRSKSA